MAAMFGPTGQNMAAIFGSGADIIWHGGTEYCSHIMSGRTKYGCHNWSAGQFLGRTFCAVTVHTIFTAEEDREAAALLKRVISTSPEQGIIQLYRRNS